MWNRWNEYIKKLYNLSECMQKLDYSYVYCQILQLLKTTWKAGMYYCGVTATF